MGRDVSGQPVVADLTRMPHLLIAGTTGSGKSICIMSLAACLVMNNQPADLRLVLLDPKMVELARLNGLPHLFGQVETEVERMLGVLRWVIVEMDRRYRLLEEARARDIHAAALAVDFAVLGPVGATASHPQQQPLGWERFARLIAASPLPVYALGGMRAADLPGARLRCAGHRRYSRGMVDG